MPSTSSLPLEKLLPGVLDNVNVALIVVDAEGRMVFHNQAALQLFGRAEAMSGLSFSELRLDYLVRDEQGRPVPLEEAPIMRALAGEEVPPQYNDVTLPDGRRRWLHAASHRFSVFGITGVFVIIADETEQVALRQALEQAQSIEAFGLIVGALTHDLNNMLSVISGNVASLQGDKSVPEKARARLEEVTVALRRGAALATKLVRYRRTKELETRPVQINEVVDNTLKLVRPLLTNRVRVKAELGLVPSVEVDSSRIEQVLVNLILNALDAMPEGGELTLRTETVEPAAETDLDEDPRKRARSFVCITVSDTGIGIPEKLHPYIFDPFFTTKPPGKGSGLGLASADAIVRQHGGHIRVQSAPNAGAKFSIYLPTEEKASTSRKRAA
jgi:two-component system, cell cycle sensor histidine kinase and response regulator CckA